LRILLRIFLWILAGAAALGWLAWHLAFRLDGQMPDRLDGPVQSPVDIVWIDGRDALVNLEASGDVDAALGVVHGLGRPWLLALYRQAALGRLAEWFGREAIPFDRHVRTMGIPVEADRAEAAISPQSYARLGAYASGVNRAQDAVPWDLLAATLSLDIQTEAWEPRHSIAVERLWTWLSTEIPMDAEPELDSLRQNQERLASFLGLHGLSRSAVWSTAERGMFARLMVGDSGIPPIITLSVHQGERLIFEGATVTGLPYPVCGHSSLAVWCKPFSGRSRRAADSDLTDTEVFSISVSDGSRVTGSRTVRAGRLVLGASAIEWAGLSRVSDADSWFDLPSPQRAFELARGTGLSMSSPRSEPLSLGEAWAPFGSVTMSSIAPEATLLAQRIDLVDDTLAMGRSLLDDTGIVLPDSLLLYREEYSEETRSYLRNWDGLFTPSSIAASIYDVAAAYPRGSPRDSLTRWFGGNPLRWRWESDPELQLRYPGASLGHTAHRYGPVDILRTGHPTAPSWGASRAWDPSGTTQYRPESAWEAYLGSTSDPLVYRRPAVPYQEFLGRYRASPVRPRLETLTERPIIGRTRVVPAGD
jgi:penicillin G amidase